MSTAINPTCESCGQELGPMYMVTEDGVNICFPCHEELIETDPGYNSTRDKSVPPVKEVLDYVQPLNVMDAEWDEPMATAGTVPKQQTIRYRFKFGKTHFGVSEPTWNETHDIPEYMDPLTFIHKHLETVNQVEINQWGIEAWHTRCIEIEKL